MAAPRREPAAGCADVAERTCQWEGVSATPSLARQGFTAAGCGPGRERREAAARQKPARPSLQPLVATPPSSPSTSLPSALYPSPGLSGASAAGGAGEGRAPEYADEGVTDSSAFQCPSETRELLPQLLTPDCRLPQIPTAGQARGCAHRLRAAAAAAAARQIRLPRAQPRARQPSLPRPEAPVRPGRAWMEGAARAARCSV